jgi:CRP-like cAMP-binding protein
MTPQDFEKLEAAIKMQPFAKFFTDDDYEQFKKVFKERGFKKGQKILWRGQKGFFFFIIGAGKISVRVTGDDKKEKIVTYLKPGDFVGEISLLYNRPRVADCYAEEDNTLLFLLASRPFFDVFVANPQVRGALEEIAQSRMAQTKKISKDTEAPESKPVSLNDMVIDMTPLEPLSPEEIDAPLPTTREEKKKPSPVIEVELPPLTPEPEEELPTQIDLDVDPGLYPKETLPHKDPVLPAPGKKAKPEPLHPLSTDESLLMPEEGILFPEADPFQNEIEHADSPPEGILLSGILKQVLCWYDESIITHIQSLCHRKNLRRGEILSDGDIKSFIIVGKGELTVKDTDHHVEISIPEGSHFGELSLIFPLETRFEYKAAADSTLYIINTEESLSAFLDLPGVKKEIEVKAIRRICSSRFRYFSTEPSVEKHLTALFKNYSVEFCTQ